ncbi:MAG: ECF transporter S component, partial [Lachnospiraceae bacterium]|nr:ECF transporter S component [Lachnospiraceae bacterium]
MRKEKSYELVLTALFTAIIVLMAFTPLGYIPLVVINATIIHIPVILGALFCGPKKGAFLGFVFGLPSFVKNT